MAESPKGIEPDNSGEPSAGTGKLHELLMDSDLETDQSPELPFNDEMIEKVMQEFYKEISAPPEKTFPTPSAAAFFMENGKNESCGASVSDSGSTVMAGIQFFVPAGNWKLPESGNGPWSTEGFGGIMDSCDGADQFDDE